MIDTRAIIMRKNFTAESVGGGEDSSHRRYGAAAADAPGRVRGGVAWEEQSGGKVRGKTMEESKLDVQHVYFLFQPSLDFGEKYRKNNNSTAPLALRISVSQSCPSLNTASLATRQVALCILKDPSISKDREGERRSRKHTRFTGGKYHTKVVPSGGNVVALGITQ